MFLLVFGQLVLLLSLMLCTSLAWSISYPMLRLGIKLYVYLMHRSFFLKAAEECGKPSISEASSNDDGYGCI
jgi:hypothetical protein